MVKLFGISHFVKMSMSEKEELLPTKRNFCDCCRNNREFSLWCRKGKAFCEHPFALRHQQPEKDKQNGDVPPIRKNFCGPPCRSVWRLWANRRNAPATQWSKIRGRNARSTYPNKVSVNTRAKYKAPVKSKGNHNCRATLFNKKEEEIARNLY